MRDSRCSSRVLVSRSRLRVGVEIEQIKRIARMPRTLQAPALSSMPSNGNER